MEVTCRAKDFGNWRVSREMGIQYIDPHTTQRFPWIPIRRVWDTRAIAGNIVWNWPSEMDSLAPLESYGIKDDFFYFNEALKYAQKRYSDLEPTGILDKEKIWETSHLLQFQIIEVYENQRRWLEFDKRSPKEKFEFFMEGLRPNSFSQTTQKGEK